MNSQYWTTDEAYKAGYDDGRKESADRLEALQRVADAAKRYEDAYEGNGERPDIAKKDLFVALRALESSE